MTNPGRGIEYAVKIDRDTLLRRVLVRFAATQQLPEDSFRFDYKGTAICMKDGCTPETPNSIGMKDDIEVINLSTKVYTGQTFDLNKALVVFKHGGMDRHHFPPMGYYFPRNTKLYNVLKAYTNNESNHCWPVDRLEYSFDGKIIPKELKITLEGLRLNDCDIIHVNIRVQQEEVVIIFKDENDGSDVLVATRFSPIHIVLNNYSERKEVPPNQFHFRHLEKEIPFDSEKTLSILGIKSYDTIQVELKDDTETPADEEEIPILLNIKDEYNDVQQLRAKPKTQIGKVITAYLSNKRIPAEQLVFTSDGVEISTTCEDTLAGLAIKDEHVIHVAEKTTGTHLTDGSIQIMYNMKGSVDNPSFRPHLQIIDTVEAKHRNHWKVSCTMCCSKLYYSCLSPLFFVLLLVYSNRRSKLLPWRVRYRAK